MTVTADALDLLAGDPPRYPHVPGDFHRHPETGAPYVNHPTETRKDGTPKRVMYGRPSSFGSALDNPFNLLKWKERQLLIGVGTLQADGEVLFDEILIHDRDELDGLAARCHDAAGSHLAADQGTHIHLLCELLDGGDYPSEGTIDDGVKLGIPAELQYHILSQWQQFRARLGLTALAVEQTVVNDRWRLAGTLDRLDVADRDILTAYGVLEAGVPFVGDIKTTRLHPDRYGQPNWWTKYPVQLAAYVDAVPYDTETDERKPYRSIGGFTPNPHIALIYHYDLARALAGEVVDWQIIPVNVDAGREGGDLCRQAADFAKRRDLFAMPAPSAVPTVQAAAVEQQAADPEPSPASTTVPGPAVDRERLRARIKDLCDQGHETLLRRYWPEGVPTLKHDGHTDAQLQLILAAVRRVEAEVGAGWHPDDGPPPHVNTNPRAVVAYTNSHGGYTTDEGGFVVSGHLIDLDMRYRGLTPQQTEFCKQVAEEANAVGRSISVSQNPTVRRWSIARAVIAWAASGRTVDELWFAASNLATFEQCQDPSATLGGLISRFTIEQADRLYDAAQAATHTK